MHGLPVEEHRAAVDHLLATASVIIIDQHRLAPHQSRLAESVNPYNPVYQNTLAYRVD